MTLRDEAIRIFMAGVAAADPADAVRRHLSGVARPDVILAAGKAAIRMAQPAMDAFPGVRCLIVTNYENAQDVPGAEVFAAGHPVPDENGARAAEAVLAAAADGAVLALISGGGSALLPAPVDGVTLADKARVNDVLLGAGLDIGAMNEIRQQLSRIKGGGLARAAGGPVTALILSDVVGDDLAVIASGPTVAAIGTRASARKVLENHDLWGSMPVSVRDHLSQDRPAAADVSASNILVGSNALSVTAMQAAEPDAKVILPPVEGDVADAAVTICEAAERGVTVWGGETTVVLRGSGRGGRNQELGLRVALEATRRGWTDWVCVQGGSDGRDGPTDAAGAVVDHGTLDRIAAAGGDIDALLANNDSYAALKLAGDLLMTGATGTNVADLGVLIRRA